MRSELRLRPEPRHRDGSVAPAGPCDAVAAKLAGMVDDSVRLDRTERRHVEQCLRCQAELAQYRKLLKAMQALRSSVTVAPIGLVAEVLATIETEGERRAVRATLAGRRAAYLGGIAAAATAAGAGAAIVLVTRGRNRRLPLAG